MMINRKRSAASRSALRRRARVWVTAYSVTRHYGGPEEGGWWYNWYEPMESLSTPVRFAEARARKLRRKWENYRMFGDIYSVLGGEAVSIHIEHTRYDSQSTKRPHYE